MPLYYAIIGASRGMGLEFVRQLASQPDTVVFALARDTSGGSLKALAANHTNVHLIQGDITDHRSLSRAASEVASISGGVLDVLIHSAARMNRPQIFRSIDDYDDFDELDADFAEAFNVNTLGVIHTLSTFIPLLRRGLTKKIVVISTGGASPELIVRTGDATIAAYCITKAAAVMVAAKYAARLKDEGFTVMSIHPGVIDSSGTEVQKVDQSCHWLDVIANLKKAGFHADLLTMAQSVERQLKLVAQLTPEQNGAFLWYTGEAVL